MRRGILAALLLLGGCGQNGREGASEAVNVELSAPPTPPGASAPLQPRTSDAAVTETAAPANTPQTAPVVSAPQLAYTYTAAIEAPARSVRPLLARHETACANAGPTVCQVTAITSETVGRDSVQAELTLRARPEWLRRFRTGLEGDARGAGGRVTGTGTASEDLTRSIVDSEARLRAQTTLRDRLVRLLAERPGGIEDVLRVEQELARVQGEIDALTSGLALMRTRVQTSTLTVSYASVGVAAPDGVWSPLGSALRDSLRNVVLGLAGLVTLLSWLLPFGALVAAGVWLWRRLRPKRKAKAAMPARQPSPSGEGGSA